MSRFESIPSMATNTTEQPGLGPGDGPYTNPSLQANLFFRVFLGILANICCWVPMKLLWSNGEFAAAVFCLTTMVLNVFYSVNAMIWPDENTAKWWLGHGWCDMQVYLFYALDTLYTACVFEIMRQLADKVALSRVTSLSRAERRRRHLVSGLVIFPIPLLQVIMTWFVQSQRYSIGPLIGCLANYDSTLPYLITFVIPPPILTLGAAIFAALTWKRFRDVDRNNRNLLSSSGNEMAIRQARVRRKLYFLTLAILIPYSVVQFLFLASNITSQVSWSRPYNYDQIHYNPPPNQWTGSSPNAWNRITFILTDELDFASQNMNYTPILTVIPLFVSFGATKEAINVYRRYLLKLGLGRIWPRLEEEYDPDISTSGTTRAAWSLKMPSILRSKSKRSSPPMSTEASLASRTRSSDSTTNDKGRELAFLTAPVSLEEIATSSSPVDTNPWPDLSAEPATRTKNSQLPPRNPWLMRTTSSHPVKLPPVAVPGFLKKKVGKVPGEKTAPFHRCSSRVACGSERTWDEGDRQWTNSLGDSIVRTQVWSDDMVDVESTGPHETGERYRSAEDQPNVGRVRVDTHIASSSTEEL